MKLKRFIILFFLIIPKSYADNFTLRQYLDEVLKRHPELAVQNFHKQAQHEMVKSKKEKLLPEVSLKGTKVKGYSTLDKEAEYSEVYLSLQQPLYAPIKSADLEVEKQEAIYQNFLTKTKVDEVVFITLQLLLNFYEKNDHSSIVSESLKTTKMNLNATKKRKSFGELTQNEIDLTNAQYWSQQTLLNIREDEVSQSKQTLQQYTGIKDPPLAFKEQIFKVLKDRDGVLNYQQSERIDKAKLAVNENIKKYNATKAKHHPQLSLIARHGFNDRYGSSIGVEEETVFGLSLTIPIYNGGSIETESSALYKNILASRATLKQEKENIENEKNIYLSQIDSLNKSLYLTKKTIQSLTKALKGIKRKHKTGDSSKLEIYNHQAKIIEFKHKRITLLYQLKNVQLNLFYLAGKLNKRLTDVLK